MRALLAALVLIAAPLPAMAQTWQEYRYPEAGFVIQFPAAPTLTDTAFTTRQGLTVPARLYALHEAGGDFSVTVADFSGTTADRVTIMAEGVAAAAGEGKVTIDMIAHIDLQFGRQISTLSPGGKRRAAVVFLLERRLFIVTGTARTQAGSDRIARFVDGLSFPGQPGGPSPDEVLSSLSRRN